MLRSFRYRLYPSRTQERTLCAWLELTRELYNAALQERRDAWHKKGVHVSLYEQMRALNEVKAVRPDVAELPVVVLRGTLRRLDRAFSGFFRRCKTGQKPGYPRFRGRGRFESLLIDDLGQRSPLCAGGKRVAIPKLGKVRLKLHRPLGGVPKALRLKREATGHWFVTFACEGVPVRPLPPIGREVGIDVGLRCFVALSDGTQIDHPKPLQAAGRSLGRAQRRVTRRKRGSARRCAAIRLLARRHDRVAQIRRQHAIDVANLLVRTHDLIAIEDLNVKALAASSLARPVADVAWSTLFHWLRTKAEEAGRAVIEVDPRGTSQRCSGCGTEVRKTLAVRVHQCPSCGLVLNRDVNAARNILALGRSAQGGAPAVRGPRRSAKVQRPTEAHRDVVVGHSI